MIGLTGSFDRYMHGIGYAKGVDFFLEVQKKNRFVWCLIPDIQPIPVCHISNERVQTSDNIYNLLFMSRDYTLIVMIELIY